MTYHFDKNFIPRHTLQEQLEALKEKLRKDHEQWAPTELPFDADDLDEQSDNVTNNTSNPP